MQLIGWERGAWQGWGIGRLVEHAFDGFLAAFAAGVEELVADVPAGGDCQDRGEGHQCVGHGGGGALDHGVAVERLLHREERAGDGFFGG